MATLGFELCQEDHVRNAARWNESNSRRHQYFSGGSSRGGRASDASSSVYYDQHADECTTASYFSDHDSNASDNSNERAMVRKRKCLVWMMALYMLVASITFFTVLLWRMGFIFNGVDDSLSKFSSGSGQTGFNDDGEMLCNGLVNNCNRRVNEIMYATVHNAMSSRENRFIAYNNIYSLEEALAAGFRGLTIDSCDCARIGIQLCHAVCIAGFRKPLPVFENIVDFMKRNPHEIVIIELQIGEDSLGPLFDIIEQVSGFEDLLYQHPGEGLMWPTLKELIEMDRVSQKLSFCVFFQLLLVKRSILTDLVIEFSQRLLIFQHDDANCEAGSCPFGVHNTYSYMFETPFQQKGAVELLDFKATCVVNRGWSNADFVVSNHFATDAQGLPDYDIAAVVNTMDILESRTQGCLDFFEQSRYGQETINLLVVDFWHLGDVLEFVFRYNSKLPVITDAPSEIPSAAPTTSPEPSFAPSANIQVPIDSILSTQAPTAKPPSAPTLVPTDPALTLTPSAPLINISPPTFSDNEALFDMLLGDTDAPSENIRPPDTPDFSLSLSPTQTASYEQQQNSDEANQTWSPTEQDQPVEAAEEGVQTWSPTTDYQDTITQEDVQTWLPSYQDTNAAEEEDPSMFSDSSINPTTSFFATEYPSVFEVVEEEQGDEHQHGNSHSNFSPGEKNT
jgi:hypothetical protein